MIHRSAFCASLTLGFVLVALNASALQQKPPVDPKPVPKQTAPVQSAPVPATPAPGAPVPVAVTPPPDYVIGGQDVLSIVFWRDKDMSADVTVRPDGKISLPLLNEVQAAGYTPEQLRTRLIEAAGKYLDEPNVTVVVREIHSRNVFITGNVSKPGTYTLVGDMNVLQLIALAGGLLEWADSKNIVVIHTENGRPEYRKFNYNDVIKHKHVEQNVLLKSTDTVVVP
jgi:polysaccharide export outer membrane protein